MVTLDGLCAARGVTPDWIRMDVQGAEFDVLRGAMEVIRAGRGRLRWIVEMHPVEWPLFGVEARSVVALLAQMGLHVENLRPGAVDFDEGDHALLTDL